MPRQRRIQQPLESGNLRTVSRIQADAAEHAFARQSDERNNRIAARQKPRQPEDRRNRWPHGGIRPDVFDKKISHQSDEVWRNDRVAKDGQKYSAEYEECSSLRTEKVPEGGGN